MSTVPMRLIWNTTNSELVDDAITEERMTISEGEAQRTLNILNKLINDYEPDELVSVEVIFKHRRGYHAITGFVPPKN